MKPAVHPFRTDDPRLQTIHEKVLAGKELDLNDVTVLFASKDILAIGWLANYMREQMHGHATQYGVDTMAFANGAESGEAAEFVVLGSDVDRVGAAVANLRKHSASAVVSAMTVEQIAGNSAKGTLQKLRDAGVSSLLGSGAELFLPAVRKVIWNTTNTAEQRAEARSLAAEARIQVPAYVVQRTASPEQQARELLSFRNVQAKAFSSISFDPDATTDLNLVMTTGMQEMKQIAIARLALGHIPHVRAYLQMLGGKLAQIALRFGASSLDGTLLDASEPQAARAAELAREITVAGREPHELSTVRRLIVTA
ncbi:hypothetical protein [Candidatus Korobacter versatilis]|nr:hypothetical protein [Candidatus Koribacter versatilis]